MTFKTCDTVSTCYCNTQVHAARITYIYTGILQCYTNTLLGRYVYYPLPCVHKRFIVIVLIRIGFKSGLNKFYTSVGTFAFMLYHVGGYEYTSGAQRKLSSNNALFRSYNTNEKVYGIPRPQK